MAFLILRETRLMRPSRLVILFAIGLCGISRTSTADDFPKSIVSWEPSPANPVFKGEGGSAWDKKIRERGWVALDGKTYHLWYTGYNEDLSPLRKLGHATSPDGVRWTRDP